MENCDEARLFDLDSNEKIINFCLEKCTIKALPSYNELMIEESIHWDPNVPSRKNDLLPAIPRLAIATAIMCPHTCDDDCECCAISSGMELAAQSLAVKVYCDLGSFSLIDSIKRNLILDPAKHGLNSCLSCLLAEADSFMSHWEVNPEQFVTAMNKINKLYEKSVGAKIKTIQPVTIKEK